MAANPRDLIGEYKTFDLKNFTIYRDASERHSWEMITLDQLMNRPGLDSLLVDGFILYEDEEFYIRGVSFSTLAIEGYGDSEMHCVSHNVCIQSDIGGLKNVWYRLSKP